VLVAEGDPLLVLDLEVEHGLALAPGERLHPPQSIVVIFLEGLGQLPCDLSDPVLGNAELGILPFVEVAGIPTDRVVAVLLDVRQHAPDGLLDLSPVERRRVARSLQVGPHASSCFRSIASAARSRLQPGSPVPRRAASHNRDRHWRRCSRADSRRTPPAARPETAESTRPHPPHYPPARCRAVRAPALPACADGCRGSSA